MILETSPAGTPLSGVLTPPGDKSISHRALIFGSLASGCTRVQGILDGEDVKATAAACRQLGARIEAEGDAVIINGVGQGGLQEPDGPLDMGNSGTAMRLLAGVLAAQDFDSVLVGDDSLNRRPMRRIVTPLTQMGAQIETGEGGTPPMHIRGNPHLSGIDYESPVASAQVKSCVLLAGLYARGVTSVSEPMTSRDHTEKMLPAFGIEMPGPCAVRGGSALTAANVNVPADISSAAFFLVAGALVPGSELLLMNVGMNATRDGIIHVLQAMGADLEIRNLRESAGEKVADLNIRHAGRLRGVDIPEALIPSLIDELPIILALAATCEGTTRLRGAEELRVKESDRLAVMARGLATLGVELTEYPDGMDVSGGEIGQGAVDGAGDHRCAMSFLVLGQVASGTVTVGGCENINTSYPDFLAHLREAGGLVKEQHSI